MSKVYHLKQTQFIPANMDTVWAFFSTPNNVMKITPTYMKFKVIHMSGGEKMYAGQLISYKVRPFPFMFLRWTTEIKNVAPKEYFTDEQKLGPFVLFNHQHFFKEKDGGVEMIDELDYALPLGLLGRVAHQLFVKKRIQSLFEYRGQIIEKIFQPQPK